MAARTGSDRRVLSIGDQDWKPRGQVPPSKFSTVCERAVFL